jgi:hypothetical protein
LDTLFQASPECSRDVNTCGDALVPYTLSYSPLKIEFGSVQADTAGSTIFINSRQQGFIVDSFLAAHSTWDIVEEVEDFVVVEEVINERENPIIYRLRRQLDRLQFPQECKNLWIDRFFISGFGFTESALEYGLSLGTCFISVWSY